MDLRTDRPIAAPTWDAGRYDRSHGYVWTYGADLVELLAPQAGERILDLGCGTGHLTNRIAESLADVVGIDSAPGMIEQARRNYPAVAFEHGDARDFLFPEPFDAIFSNAVLHWVKDHERVANRIAASLRPGGRLAVELGGRGNIRQVVSALESALADVGVADTSTLNPWRFPSIAEFASVLETAGLRVSFAALFDRPTLLDGGVAGMRDWLLMYCNGFLAEQTQTDRERILAAVEDRLRASMLRDGVWTADYCRLRVVAIRE